MAKKALVTLNSIAFYLVLQLSAFAFLYISNRLAMEAIAQNLRLIPAPDSDLRLGDACTRRRFYDVLNNLR